MPLMHRDGSDTSLWRDFESLRRRMMGMFDGETPFAIAADWTPAVDVSETETEYKIHAALPAVKKEDVKVALENGALTIRGERRSRKEDRTEKRHRVEIEEGTFFRSFAMPSDADADKITARYHDGVLDVTVAKSAATKKSNGRTIAIQ